ncbi:carbohydrate sulfotransferase 13-like [Haliotis rubra]|uniref:carbohydrate sulfotransferase 13-like n=1 Tax=Haliotis rubra TaxID=36100 RepID=UPI001EE54E8C|nr:carbohydrate sulfotransferase 13-like [Haliotis rubra]
MKISLEHRFAQRRELLQKSCQKNIQYFQMGFPKIPPDLKVTAKVDSSICPIEKVGSTFWIRMLAVFEKDLAHKSRSNLTTQSATRRKLSPLQILSTRKYIFVRNPYTRLLSGYVDKFFAVNPAFWKIIGREIVMSTRYRDMPNAVEQTCGDDVRFDEFVSYILDSDDRDLQIDGHFAPIHRHCGICEIQYDYIGKMETLLDDMVYFADDMGMLDLNGTKHTLLNEGVRWVNQMFFRNACSLFTHRRDAMESCGVTLNQGLHVTWKRWQIRGMISMEIPFPDEANDVEITCDKFVALATEANARSNPDILSRGKDLALKEAYGSLSHEVKIKLRKYFEPEFVMFDYESNPDFVFGEYQNSENIFSFFGNKYN